MIEHEKFADKTLKFKIFTDSDTTGTKVLLNLLNIKAPNSTYHHYIMLLSTGSDTKYNRSVYFKYLNESMETLHSLQIPDHPLSFIMTLDTKAQWQVKISPLILSRVAGRRKMGSYYTLGHMAQSKIAYAQ